MKGEPITAPHGEGFVYPRGEPAEVLRFGRLIDPERPKDVDCITCGRYLPGHSQKELAFCDRWLIELKYYWNYWTRVVH